MPSPKPQPPYTRAASHSGSWYSSSPTALSKEIDSYLTPASSSQSPSSPSYPTAQISPHAGYSYAGKASGKSFSEGLQTRLSLNISIPPVKTIVVLHPSHYLNFKGGGVVGIYGGCEGHECVCPFNNENVSVLKNECILVDDLKESMDKKKIVYRNITKAEGEKEHSFEMMLPFISRCLYKSSTQGVTLLPLMIPSINKITLQDLGIILNSVLLNREDVYTIVSTDFCHWGERFDYTPSPSSSSLSMTNKIELHEYIKKLDQEGMREIELVSPGGFNEYIKRTGNTICGRFPISIFLSCLRLRSDAFAKIETANGEGDDVTIKFVVYEQSAQLKLPFVKGGEDSSVSYVGGVVYRNAAEK